MSNIELKNEIINMLKEIDNTDVLEYLHIIATDAYFTYQKVYQSLD